MAHLDFRSFMEQLKQDDDLVELDQEVDPHLEIAAITRKVHETNNKAVLFNNVKGNKNGLWRIIGAPASLRPIVKEQFGRIARHVGLPPTASFHDILELVRTGEAKTPIPPRTLTSEQAPCKQNVLRAGGFDLEALPAPLLHQPDGGKFIQTLGMHVISTPNGKWTNWSISRGQVHDKDHLVGALLPGQHLIKIVTMWKAQGKKEIPWALCFGVPPAVMIASSLSLPDNVDECNYVGAIYGEPVQVVKCETNDLLVPATCEIVFEGTISLTETAPEGPFGDQPGYIFPGEQVTSPLFKVNTITYRDNPILPLCVPGRATDETHTLCGGLAAAVLKQDCLDADLPVLDTHTLFETQGIWLVVQIDTDKLRRIKIASSEALRKLIGDTIYRRKMGFLIHRIFLVGPDVDIYDFDDVMFAFATRCRPGGMQESVYEDKEFTAFKLVPFMSHGYGDRGTGGKAVHDCLLPAEYTVGQNWIRADFKHCYPRDLQEKINARWEEWGFV